MFATKFLGIGFFLLIVGVALTGTFFSHAVDTPVALVAGSLLALGGFALMALGFMTLAGAEFRPKKGIHNDDANVFTVGLIRCMIAISVADNTLDDSEVAEIAKIYKHLTKADIDPAVIRQTADEMLSGAIDIVGELDTLQKTLNNELKQKLVIASLYILAADGDMEDGELSMLECIREGLKLPKGQVERIKTDFLAKRDLK